MPRIRCHYDDCVFIDDGYCGAAAVELEPDSGCLTFTRVDEATTTDEEEEWEEDELDEFDEEEEDLYDDEDDDNWDDEDDDDF
jgi:hypothetical protein